MEEPCANSSRLVLPNSGMPAALSFSMTVASYGGTQPSRILEAAVVSMPLVTIMSLMAIGTPASSGRAALSSADLASKASACSRATSPETFRKALMDGSAASITLRWASTSSREVTSPFLTAAACSAADSLTRVAVSLLIDYSSLPRIRGATNMPASVFGPPASASSCVSGVSATSGRR